MTESLVPIKQVRVEKAAEMLGKTSQAIRQLMLHGKLGRHMQGRHVFVDLDSVLNYQAKKKGLPSWEENASKISDKSFVSLQSASIALLVQPGYIIKLIRAKELEGYISMNGEIFLCRESINAYLRTPSSDLSTSKK
jgi:hypothetical protein